MADFRRMFFALAVVMLMFTTVASAQLPYSCSATAVPTLVRSEGIAEQTGDILLTCSNITSGNGVPALGIIANIRVRLNTNITSNVLDEGPPVVTDSILILDELTARPRIGYTSTGPFVQAVNQTIYEGLLLSDTEVEFQGVVLAEPGSDGAQTIRITNVRGNASALGTNATIFGTVNITGSTTVPVNNNSLVVADTRPGMKFSVTGGTFKNCEVPDEDPDFSLEFQEGFASAFRPVGEADADNLVPGGAYRNESGFNPDTLDGGVLVGNGSIGQADQGTRLMAGISGIPSGVTLTVPEQIETDAGMVLQAVTGTNSDGSGGTVTSGADTVDFTDRIVYEVVWVTGLSYSSQETVSVDVDVSYDIPGPLGTGVIKGTFAPLSTVFTASADDPEPRFIDNGTATDVFTIVPCRTILLFPFVTNQAGFDTGLAISNTSADPLGTGTQEGACTLYYYGNSSGAAAPAAQTSPTVPAGGHLVMSLSTGGGVFAPDDGFTACATGSCVAPLFQGYIFAICDFQFAHGFGFITDFGAAKLAQGYLALIIPDRADGRLPQHSAYDASSNEGENTGN